MEQVEDVTIASAQLPFALQAVREMLQYKEAKASIPPSDITELDRVAAARLVEPYVGFVARTLWHNREQLQIGFPAGFRQPWMMQDALVYAEGEKALCQTRQIPVAPADGYLRWMVRDTQQYATKDQIESRFVSDIGLIIGTEILPEQYSAQKPLTTFGVLALEYVTSVH